MDFTAQTNTVVCNKVPRVPVSLAGQRSHTFSLIFPFLASVSSFLLSKNLPLCHSSYFSSLPAVKRQTIVFPSFEIMPDRPNLPGWVFDPVFTNHLIVFTWLYSHAQSGCSSLGNLQSLWQKVKIAMKKISRCPQFYLYQECWTALAHFSCFSDERK